MLAFADSMALVEEAKLGILTGSLISGVIGFLVLRFAPSDEYQDTVEQLIDQEVNLDGDARIFESRVVDFGNKN